MTPTKAITSGFKNALVFSGRARRPEYWWFFAFVFAGAAVLGVIEHYVLGGQSWLTRVFQLIVFLPFLAVAWRRAQDTGRPGWWVVVPSAVVVATALIAGSVSRTAMTGIVERPATMSEADALASGGMSGLFLALAILQIAAGALLLWWMSRPSQRGVNEFGPEPRVE